MTSWSGSRPATTLSTSDSRSPKSAARGESPSPWQLHSLRANQCQTSQHIRTTVPQLTRRQRRPGHACISGGFLMCAVFVSVMCGAIMKVTRRRLALETFQVATFGNIICAKVWFVRPVPEQTGDFDNVRLDISLLKCEFSSVPLLRFSRSICPDSRHYCPQMSLSLKCRRSRGRALRLRHKQSHCFCFLVCKSCEELVQLIFHSKNLKKKQQQILC